jgi:hypothetical protein
MNALIVVEQHTLQIGVHIEDSPSAGMRPITRCRFSTHPYRGPCRASTEGMQHLLCHTQLTADVHESCAQKAKHEHTHLALLSERFMQHVKDWKPTWLMSWRAPHPNVHCMLDLLIVTGGKTTDHSR